MSKNYYPPRRERRRGGLGCLGTLVALVWIALLLILGYRYFLRPQISQIIGDQLSEQARPPVATAGPGGATGDLSQQAGAALPTVIAALPSGEIRVSEQQANEFLASRSLGPLESASVRFVPGEMLIDLAAFGFTSTARTGLAVQDGRIIPISPQIDGPLGQLISLEDLTASLTEQLNGQLAAQNRRVTDARIDQGELVVNVE